MAFRYGAPTDAERQAFESWRQQSAAHEAAWARAQSVFMLFKQVPADIGKEALKTLDHNSGRRRSLRLLSAALMSVPASWLALRQLPLREWTADVATATGERQSLQLPDGSRLVLNTASAVDIDFNAAQRRIRLLSGEILITTHADSSPVNRPFLIDTPHGVVRALGTRFSVRHVDDDTCRVLVFEHAVEVSPLGGAVCILRAGEQADFNVAGMKPPVSADNTAALWEQGMLLAKNMRLADVIAELARYRHGVLRCDPAVADLRVSGAMSLADTDAALALLVSSLPLRINRNTRYWVTVAPAG